MRLNNEIVMFFNPGIEMCIRIKKKFFLPQDTCQWAAVMRFNNEIEIIDSGHFQVDSVNTDTLRVDVFQSWY